MLLETFIDQYIYNFDSKTSSTREYRFEDSSWLLRNVRFSLTMQKYHNNKSKPAALM